MNLETARNEIKYPVRTTALEILAVAAVYVAAATLIARFLA